MAGKSEEEIEEGLKEVAWLNAWKYKLLIIKILKLYLRACF